MPYHNMSQHSVTFRQTYINIPHKTAQHSTANMRYNMTQRIINLCINTYHYASELWT